MGKPAKSESPKWILIGTGTLGLIAAGLVLVVRYYEINKARAEAEQARISADRALTERERPKGTEPTKSPTAAPPLPVVVPSTAPPVVSVQPQRPAPDQVIGKWVERRPGAPAGDRERTFRPDGTLTLYMPKSRRTINGTWRREGNRVYFSHSSTDGIEAPTRDKWFTIVSVNADELVLLMVGERQYTWFRSS